MQKVFICQVAIPVALVLLLHLFVIGLAWAIALYMTTRDVAVMLKDADARSGNEIFKLVAEKLSIVSQKWYSIATAVFVGGLIYAIYHSGELSCHWLGNEASNKDWKLYLVEFLPNIFIYSLFFAVWRWSVGMYRVSARESLRNIYKFCALQAVDRIIQDEPSLDAKIALHKECAHFILASSSEISHEETRETDKTPAEYVTQIEEAARHIAEGKER